MAMLTVGRLFYLNLKTVSPLKSSLTREPEPGASTLQERRSAATDQRGERPCKDCMKLRRDLMRFALSMKAKTEDIILQKDCSIGVSISCADYKLHFSHNTAIPSAPRKRLLQTTKGGMKRLST